jgi:hypothetical protein
MARRIWEKFHGREVKTVHLFGATAHFKGFHDALGKLVDRIRDEAESKVDPATGATRRISSSWLLYKLVREKIHGFKENVGPGLQSINRFHVHYAASKEDDHRGEEGVVFIDRSTKAMNVDCEALEDTHGTYCVGGFNRFEDDHLCKRFVFCPCQSCRPPAFDFDNCKLKDWTGTWENHTIAYKSGAAVTEKKKEMKASIRCFSEEVELGTFLVVGMSAKEAAADSDVINNSTLRFSVVRTVDVPFFTEKRITENVEGVIQKGNWVCEVQWLKRVSALGFVPEDTAFDMINMESCILIKDLRPENRDGVFHITPDDHARIKARNLARFSSYH